MSFQSHTRSSIPTNHNVAPNRNLPAHRPQNTTAPQAPPSLTPTQPWVPPALHQNPNALWDFMKGYPPANPGTPTEPNTPSQGSPTQPNTKGPPPAHPNPDSLWDCMEGDAPIDPGTPTEPNTPSQDSPTQPNTPRDSPPAAPAQQPQVLDSESSTQKFKSSSPPQPTPPVFIPLRLSQMGSQSTPSSQGSSMAPPPRNLNTIRAMGQKKLAPVLALSRQFSFSDGLVEADPDTSFERGFSKHDIRPSKFITGNGPSPSPDKLEVGERKREADAKEMYRHIRGLQSFGAGIIARIEEMSDKIREISEKEKGTVTVKQLKEIEEVVNVEVKQVATFVRRGLGGFKYEIRKLKEGVEEAQKEEISADKENSTEEDGNKRDRESAQDTRTSKTKTKRVKKE